MSSYQCWVLIFCSSIIEEIASYQVTASLNKHLNGKTSYDTVNHISSTPELVSQRNRHRRLLLAHLCCGKPFKLFSFHRQLICWLQLNTCRFPKYPTANTCVQFLPEISASPRRPHDLHITTQLVSNTAPPFPALQLHYQTYDAKR